MKESIDISVFGYKSKKKYPIDMPKKCWKEKHWFLIDRKKRGKNVLIKDIRTFMYDYTIYLRRKSFDCYSLQAFRTAGTLKCHVNEGFKINAKKRLRCQKRWTCYIQKSIKENELTIFDLCIFWKNFSSKKKMGSKNPNEFLHMQISRTCCLQSWL